MAPTNPALRTTILAAILLWPLVAQAQDKPARTVSVEGYGEVLVRPDHVVLSFAVVTKDPDLAKARQQNDERARKVLAVLRESKADPKDVQTSHVQVSLEAEERRGTRADYYEFRKGFTVVVRDLERFESLFDRILEAGANEIRAARFQTSRREELYRQARESAVAAAKAKATHLATVLGQKVGRPIGVSEAPVYRDLAGWEHDFGRGGGLGGGAFNDPAPTFAEGQIRVGSEVQITFELLAPDVR